MRNIWTVFKTDIRTLSKCFFACVVVVAIALLPSLYAWLNIYSNWDPYGNTGGISIAVASLDEGYTDEDGTYENKGDDVVADLREATSINWVIVDTEEEAKGGVESGDYYAALIVPEEFTEDFVSILSGDLRHPQIQYYENEKKNAIAPKITSKAKTAVQEQINTTVIGKAAEALTTAGSVFKAMGLDSEALADGIMDKLTGARQEMAQLQKVLLSLKDVMNGADGLLTAASVTIAEADARRHGKPSPAVRAEHLPNLPCDSWACASPHTLRKWAPLPSNIPTHTTTSASSSRTWCAVPTRRKRRRWRT